MVQQSSSKNLEDKAQQLYRTSEAAKNAQKQIPDSSMWAFVLSIVPLLFSSVLIHEVTKLIYAGVMVIAISLGAYSLRNSDGRGFAYAAIIIALVQLLLVVFLL